MATLAGLVTHGEDLGPTIIGSVRAALNEVEGRLSRRELRVVVLGEKQSGKSTFLDALLGERMLGISNTSLSMVTSVRRSEQCRYRARFADGSEEEFGARVRDRTAKMTREVEFAQAAHADAARRCEAAGIEVATASEALQRVEHALAGAFHSFEQARHEAARIGTELEAAEHDRERQAEATAEHEQHLPVLVRQSPPWWAFWLWIVRLVLLLSTFHEWRAHRALVREIKPREARIAALRAEAGTAADNCAAAELELSRTSVPVENARRALADARRQHEAAEARRQEREREVDRKTRELEKVREERRIEFIAEIRQLADVSRRGKNLVELEIEYPARLLPEDVTLIETPGVGSDDREVRERAWRVLREQADGCIFISELERAVSTTSQKYLQQVREAVPHAILVLTKMDELLSDAKVKGEAAANEQVDKARRIATRRFAREVGRDPNTVLSLAVAAEEAMRDGQAAEEGRRRFETDVAKLLLLLRQERALILGAWSAGIVRRCIGEVADAETRAELSYQKRITALEAQRIPEPDQFRAQQMRAFDPAILGAAERTIASTRDALHERIGLARVACAQQIAACKTRQELREVVPQLLEAILEGVARARHEIQRQLDTHAEREVRLIEAQAFQALRERYQLLHDVTREAVLPVHIELPIEEQADAGPLGSKVDGAVKSFERLRVGFGVGGAAAGAAVGTLILPGLGTGAGALVGALAAFAKTLRALKTDCLSAVDECLANLEHPVAEQIAAAHPVVAAAIRDYLNQALEQAVARFGRWIAEPLEAERTAIEREREKLRELEALHEGLRQHDARLESMIRAAADASIGLCR